jgi:hypothetical protein
MNQGTTLTRYGIALIVLGIAAILYNAEAGQIGLYWKGKTGLFVAGGGGIAALVLAHFARKGAQWAHVAGAILAFLFLCVAFKNGFDSARKVASDSASRHLWYKASLFWLIAIFSMTALIPLLMHLRREKVD